MIIIFVSQARI